MSESIIQVQNLSKKFLISHETGGRYTSLRDVIASSVKGMIKPKIRKGQAQTEEFWALRDVNFEIQSGDRVGIIGRNGAGKSTLLKILSRITEPTTGLIRINGRVASLLEVGTGFHPELTGSENIFLNGAILGMSRIEIRKKFDEIVAFAEVEKFLDTPVKRYSSGMYVRLAFAVAAHLEPEILVVDEVLAVGDAQFQKKCLGKMEDVSKNEGRTVLFVSHSMGTIVQLCNKGILLNKGAIVLYDSTNKVVNTYLEAGQPVDKIEKEILTDTNQFKTIFMTDSSGGLRGDYKFDERIFVRTELFVPNYSESLELAMRLIDRQKRAVFTIHEKLSSYDQSNSLIKLNVVIPERFLTPGQYSWIVCINHPGVTLYDVNEDIAPFAILETGSEFSRYEGLEYGSVFAKYTIQRI